MASTTTFQLAATSLLSGTLSGTPGGQIQGDNHFRRYRSCLSVGVYGDGSYSWERRPIYYEVGRRYPRAADALAYDKDSEAVTAIDASVPINQAQAANFEGWARKFSNFSPQWDYMDLAGIAERLAKAIAAQSVYGDVSCARMRAGQPVRVVALGTVDSPQTASLNSVFIPRTVDTVGNDHVFAVLAAAANGEGAAVTTDVVRLDPANNQPVVPTVSGPALASAAVEALRVVGANMDESGAGDMFAYAVTRGIHSVVSVVSHTDEGGWMRGVLRCGTFRVPYGGINQALRDYPALPPLAGTSVGACSAWVDSVALKTAASVAHCDPCTVGVGGDYPTVVVSARGTIGAAGVAEEAVDSDAIAVGRQIKADMGRFAPLWMRALLTIFGLRSNSGVAESVHCTFAATYLTECNDRHLRHKTVAPYFWVEPTSLLPKDAFGLPAERAGFASLSTPGAETKMPTFEKVQELDRGRHADFCVLGFKMRTARTSGLVCAYAGRPSYLSAMRLYQFDEDSVALAGDQGPTRGDVPTKHAAADPLSSYLWVRGQSPLPTPAEFMNTQGNYAAKYRIVTWDDDFNGELGDLPEPWELEAHPVLLRTSVPTGIVSGTSNAADSGARRARSRAAIALAQAVLRNRGLGDALSPQLAVSNVPPLLDGPPAPTPMADQLPLVHQANPGAGLVLGEGAARPPAQVAFGPPLGPVPHHQPVRGAPYPPRGGGHVGGVLPAAPPPPIGMGPAPAPPTAAEPESVAEAALLPAAGGVDDMPGVADAPAAPQH